MSSLRPLAVIALVSFAVGVLFSYSGNDNEHRFGHTLATAGAIMIAGLCVGLAIIEAGKRLK